MKTLEEDLLDELGVGFVDVRVENVRQPVDLDKYRGTPTVLGEVLGLLDALEQDDTLLEGTTPQPLARRANDTKSYLRGLLGGMGADAAQFLIPEDQA